MFGAAALAGLPGPLWISYVSDYEIWYWELGLILYGIGATFYATKIPEKCIKKRFDIIGASHQIFHVFVLLAGMVQMWAALKIFHERQLSRCPV